MSGDSLLKYGARFLRHAARLSIQPRPINLAERRQIYDHLHQYGDILLFKSLYVSSHDCRTGTFLVLLTAIIAVRP